MKRAFTLIELLIVVAIIAILAAIAVPNFLEAQVRSKVSRVKADMRTVATALEAYAIDNNGRYPYMKAYVDAGRRDQYSRGSIFCVTCLSTPVAYLSTTNFPDPFCNIKAFNEFGIAPQDVALYASGYYSTYVFQNTWLYYKLDRGNKPVTPPNRPGFYLVSFGPDFYKGPNPFTGAEWLMGSYLTSVDADRSCRFVAWYYDPSNGTKSGGDILRMP